ARAQGYRPSRHHRSAPDHHERRARCAFAARHRAAGHAGNTLSGVGRNPESANRDFEMSEAAYVAVDWGTSSFRLWLMDQIGVVLAERRSQQGMMEAART